MKVAEASGMCYQDLKNDFSSINSHSFTYIVEWNMILL